MRKEVFLIIAILLSTTIYATCDVTDTINKTSPKNYTVDGKDYAITLSSLSNSSGDWIAKLKVNGVTTPQLEETQTYTFNDLSDIKILSIPSSTTAQICFNAGLIASGQGTCTTNADCDNNNPCTIDECDGDPLRCKRTLILWCRNDDGCCPESRCTEENDNDCGRVIIGGCINDSDCNDNNTLTIDTCDNTTKRCSNILTTECISNDTICPDNCTFISDTDCDECSEDTDCNDDNTCTTDTCSGTPKRCLNQAESGCNFNGKCISIGTRTETKFCNKENTLELLRSKKEYCDNDYECLSNRCKKNKCRGAGFFRWIMRLFGK